MEPDYDYIFAGTGAAGFSLARALVKNPAFSQKRILLIEPDDKRKNDRTWCFWHPHAYGLEPIAAKCWDQVRFSGPGFSRIFDLSPYHYWMIRGIDYYLWMDRELSSPQVTRLSGKVDTVEDHGEVARVQVNGENLFARYVFDSRPPVFTPSRQYHDLKQHFKGYFLEAEEDFFDPAVPTLFDFQTDQKGCMRFFYILPQDARHALVEYTLFSEHILPDEEYHQAIKIYLAETLHLSRYRVLEEENGVIPMNDQPLPRRLGSRVMAIGARGGRIKPSSGYAFKRIQEDSLAILDALVQTGQPFYRSPAPGRYALFDRLMLDVMQHDGGRMAAIFTRLFQRNSIQEIFSFLDEKNSLPQDLRLISSLSWGPFLLALWRNFRYI